MVDSAWIYPLNMYIYSRRIKGFSISFSAKLFVAEMISMALNLLGKAFYVYIL